MSYQVFLTAFCKIKATWPSHHVVDGGGMNKDAAVTLGHESQLVGFGLHLHGSFAGHLIVSLRGSDLR